MIDPTEMRVGNDEWRRQMNVAFDVARGPALSDYDDWERAARRVAAARGFKCFDILDEEER